MLDTTVEETFQIALDSIEQQVALLDLDCKITWVNQSWVAFGKDNGGDPDQVWLGVDYLEPCCAASAAGDDVATEVAAGFDRLLCGDADGFSVEYPCHSPSEERWFILRVRRSIVEAVPGIVVTHEDITARKIAEENSRWLANHDETTSLANRRKFEEFLETEWKKACRTGSPLSLAMIDIDHFKDYNDTYGHKVGDDCLRSVSAAVKRHARRAIDLVARFGGDEIVVVFANTDQAEAKQLAEAMRRSVEKDGLNGLPVHPQKPLTVSIGLANISPKRVAPEAYDKLLELADSALYLGKRKGRNRVEICQVNFESETKTPHLAEIH